MTEPWSAENWPPRTDMNQPGYRLRQIPHGPYGKASASNPKVPELRVPRLSDDWAFRLMFGALAFAAAMVTYVIGRFIVGPWDGIKR